MNDDTSCVIVRTLCHTTSNFAKIAKLDALIYCLNNKKKYPLYPPAKTRKFLFFQLDLCKYASFRNFLYYSYNAFMVFFPENHIQVVISTFSCLNWYQMLLHFSAVWLKNDSWILIILSNLGYSIKIIRIIIVIR